MSRSKPFRNTYTDALWAENALRPNELLVALVYAKYAGAKDGRTGELADPDVSWVEWGTLASQTKIRSRDALNRATKGLVAAGWMHQVEAARQHRSPRYKLTIPARPELRLTIVIDDAETA